MLLKSVILLGAFLTTFSIEKERKKKIPERKITPNLQHVLSFGPRHNLEKHLSLSRKSTLPERLDLSPMSLSEPDKKCRPKPLKWSCLLGTDPKFLLY